MKTSKIINMITSSFFFSSSSWIFLLLVFIRTSKSQLIPKFSFPSPPLPPRPLCLQQITLANHACGLLPYFSLPPPSPPPPTSHPPPSNGPPHSGNSPHDRHHRHHHHHHRSHHGRERVHNMRPSRHHRHRHRRHEESLIEEECCRWLKELDSECVCSLLIRLPKFMVRPLHQFSVTVDNICNVTYHCPSLWLG